MPRVCKPHDVGKRLAIDKLLAGLRPIVNGVELNALIDNAFVFRIVEPFSVATRPVSESSSPLRVAKPAIGTWHPPLRRLFIALSALTQASVGA